MQDNFWINQAPWLATQGGPNGGGGGLIGTGVDSGAIQWRGPLDAARSGALGYGRIGEATYPDGYLDNVNSRRQDRLANEVSGRLSDRSYQRGIHKGTKMDPVQYFWPAECPPDAGIRREMAARRAGTQLVKRNVPVGQPVQVLVAGGKLSQLTDPEKERVYSTYGINPAQNTPEQLVDPLTAKLHAKDMPGWSW